ncbi:MAG TPA: hypothetical protein VKM55_27350 [Candidatus Lokiarchaeia archaeon]|nr:hypothetical protein [Candidatus Lokiarchaeia archaeon]
MDLDFLNLNDKMKDWGPYGKNEGNVLVFTIGNPNEGHGPALPRDNDSRCANFVANKVCELTGARFIAAIPYATDRVGDIARDWSPAYMQMDECVEKSATFVKIHCEALQAEGIPFTRVLIINGHGGNIGIEHYERWNEISSELGMESILFSFAINYEPKVLVNSIPRISDETRDAYLGIKEGHADTLEHSIATVYNALDYGKLAFINATIKSHGIEEALKKWPVLGGLGGYLKFGDHRYDPLREIAGLNECLEKFEQDGQIYIFSDFARLVMDASVENTAKLISL